MMVKLIFFGIRADWQCEVLILYMILAFGELINFIVSNKIHENKCKKVSIKKVGYLKVSTAC